MFRRAALLGPCLLLALATLASLPARALESLQQFPSSVLTIRTHKSTEWFSVWIADTPERSEQGLMFQQWLPADQGMLFPQDAPRVMHMWMKNTLIPLDMLFLDPHGRIVHIRENASPESLDIITFPKPVAGVLELKGGICARENIRVGDRVIHALFGSAPAGPAVAK